jgi:hypothetical protein
VADRKHCAAGLAAGMTGTAVRFRILGVRTSGDRASVRTVVDGSPGSIRLVRERSRFRVLEVRGG